MTSSSTDMTQERAQGSSWAQNPFARCVARGGAWIIDGFIFGLPVFALGLLAEFAGGGGDTWGTTVLGNALLVYLAVFLGRMVVEGLGRNTWGHTFMGVRVDYPENRNTFLQATIRNSWLLVPLLVWVVMSLIRGELVVGAVDFSLVFVVGVLTVTTYGNSSGRHLFDRWAGAKVCYGAIALRK